MARRAAKIDLDLFPFLSVLCAVIGVLMLFMLSIVTTRVIASTKAAAAAAAPTDVAAEREPKAEGIDAAEYARLEAQIGELSSELADRQQRLAQLRELATQFEELLAIKEDESLGDSVTAGLLRGVPLEKPDDVEFRADQARPVNKKPRFVEVDDQGYIVHPEKTRYGVEELKAENSPIKQFIAGIDKSRQREYLLFLIHPNGIAAYQELEKFLLENYPHPDADKIGLSRIDMGAEPFSQGWLLLTKEAGN